MLVFSTAATFTQTLLNTSNKTSQHRCREPCPSHVFVMMRPRYFIAAAMVAQAAVASTACSPCSRMTSYEVVSTSAAVSSNICSRCRHT